LAYRAFLWPANGDRSFSFHLSASLPPIFQPARRSPQAPRSLSWSTGPTGFFPASTGTAVLSPELPDHLLLVVVVSRSCCALSFDLPTSRSPRPLLPPSRTHGPLARFPVALDRDGRPFPPSPFVFFAIRSSCRNLAYGAGVVPPLYLPRVPFQRRAFFRDFLVIGNPCPSGRPSSVENWRESFLLIDRPYPFPEVFGFWGEVFFFFFWWFSFFSSPRYPFLLSIHSRVAKGTGAITLVAEQLSHGLFPRNQRGFPFLEPQISSFTATVGGPTVRESYSGRRVGLPQIVPLVRGRRVAGLVFKPTFLTNENPPLLPLELKRSRRIFVGLVSSQGDLRRLI